MLVVPTLSTKLFLAVTAVAAGVAILVHSADNTERPLLIGTEAILDSTPQSTTALVSAPAPDNTVESPEPTERTAAWEADEPSVARTQNRIGKSALRLARDAEALLHVDSAGQLAIDSNTASGMETLLSRLHSGSTTLQDLQTAIKAGLPASAAGDAASLLGRYHDYLREQRDLIADAPALPDVDGAVAQLDQLAALRREHFDPTQAQALFGEQEAHARYVLEVMRLQADRSDPTGGRYATDRRAVATLAGRRSP